MPLAKQAFVADIDEGFVTNRVRSGRKQKADAFSSEGVNHRYYIISLLFPCLFDKLAQFLRASHVTAFALLYQRQK